LVEPQKAPTQTPQTEPGPPRDLATSSVQSVESALGASAEGLTTSEAQARLAKYGYNELPEEKTNPLLKFLSYPAKERLRCSGSQFESEIRFRRACEKTQGTQSCLHGHTRGSVCSTPHSVCGEINKAVAGGIKVGDAAAMCDRRMP
jgi:Cation transporter/ATPase, N-terminus